jgi:hypothetical protein
VSDEEYIHVINSMNIKELLELVVSAPEYLSDNYYWKLGHAIRIRANELLREMT